MRIRSGQKADAKHIAQLVDIAGDGLAAYVWAGMALDNEKPIDVGVRRIRRIDGNSSFTNTMIAEEDGEILGMIMAYRLSDPYVISEPENQSRIIQPLIELESYVPGSWYINALAVYEEFRGRGVAGKLVNRSEQRAMEYGSRKISLIVASVNNSAINFYEKRGYSLTASRPVVQYCNCMHAGEWLLMEKII